MFSAKQGNYLVPFL